jgi:hypothetical protein
VTQPPSEGQCPSSAQLEDRINTDARSAAPASRTASASITVPIRSTRRPHSDPRCSRRGSAVAQMALMMCEEAVRRGATDVSVLDVGGRPFVV